MKEGAIKAGYVNFGYFSPPTSSDDEYPQYIKENVKEATEKINTLKNNKSVTFTFITDIHYSKTDIHDLRTKRIINAYKNVKKDIGSDMLILGGDYSNNGNKEYNANNYICLKEHLSGLKYFPVNGNHDDNSMWDEYVGGKAVNHHTTREMYNLFYNHLPQIGAKTQGEDLLYYYYDDENNKVRYIFLDTNDVPEIYNEDGTLKYTKQCVFAISQAQIDWLVNTALKVDKGTDVVIIAHNPPLPSAVHKLKDKECTSPVYLELKNIIYLLDVFDAYNKKHQFLVHIAKMNLKCVWMLISHHTTVTFLVYLADIITRIS